MNPNVKHQGLSASGAAGKTRKKKNMLESIHTRGNVVDCFDLVGECKMLHLTIGFTVRLSFPFIPGVGFVLQSRMNLGNHLTPIFSRYWIIGISHISGSKLYILIVPYWVFRTKARPINKASSQVLSDFINYFIQ